MASETTRTADHSGSVQGNNAQQTCPSFLATLPFDALLQVLSRVPPVDILRVANALPFTAGNDRHLWHRFYVRSFGRAVPRRFYLARGYLDWSRMYREEQLRTSHLRQNRLIDTNTNTTATATATANNNTNNTRSTAPPARITVTAIGNMHRIRSTTSDENAAPVVVRGNLARFDWSKRR